MAGVEGVVAPRLEAAETQPNLVIEVDLARAQRFEITPGAVRRAEAALVQGIHAGSVFDEQKVFDVVVQGLPETRESVADIRDLLIDRPGGGHVRLGQVADVRIAPTPVAIEREAVSRYVDVEASVSGRGLGAVAADVRDRLAGLSFPLEYHAEVIEQTVGEEIGATTIAAVAALAAMACFLLFQAAFRSWRLAAVAFVLVPVALAGGVVAVLLTGAEATLGSLAGFLALLGMATRTTVLSFRRFQALEWTEQQVFGPALVRRGAQERLAPIVTSAAALALCLLPFAILGARAGLEVVHPMAVVILGGLVTATLTALFVVPAAYLRLGVATPAPALEEDGVLVAR
jgi:Cu/Ag efflux pump CusA